jgi:hypothetical protein
MDGIDLLDEGALEPPRRTECGREKRTDCDHTVLLRESSPLGLSLASHRQNVGSARVP